MCHQLGYPRSVDDHNTIPSLADLNDIDDNKTKIAKSGALVPLTRLARSKDMRVQRNATGALLNMTHSGATLRLSCSTPTLKFFSDENRQQLVNAGAIPVLVSLLNSPDTDVQYYCTTALSNIAVDGKVTATRIPVIFNRRAQPLIARNSPPVNPNSSKAWSP